MFRITLIALLPFLVLIACEGKKKGTSGAAPQGCDASNGKVEPYLANKNATPIPGVYRFVRADHIRQHKGETIVVGQSLGQERPGQNGELTCPANGSVSKTFDKTSYDFLVSELLILNSKNELDLPDKFQILDQSIGFATGSQGVFTTSIYVSNLRDPNSAQENRVKTEILNAKVIPVKDGIVVIQALNGGESRSFYRPTGAAVPPKTRVEIIPEPTFTNDECFAKVQPNLGPYKKEDVRFNRYCNVLYVEKKESIIEVRSAIKNGYGLETCNRNSTARVGLSISVDQLKFVREIQKLNNNLQVAATPIPASISVSWLDKSGKNKMVVPAINVAVDPRDPQNRSMLKVSGGISAAVDLGDETACQIWRELDDVKANQDLIRQKIVREMQIEIAD